MKLSSMLIGAGALALGGYVYYDYNSADSKAAREIKEIQTLAPDVRPPDCFPKGVNAKLFAIGIERDLRSKAELENDQVRRSAIEHDCIRGNQPATVNRVVKALGAAGVPVYAEVLEKCPVVKDEYPAYSCFALDALNAEGSKESVAAIEKTLQNHDKTRKNVYLGALYRLMNTPGWKTNAQLAAMLPAEQDWKAKELMLEYLRNHKDPAARSELEKAYTAETDLQEKGLMKAAILEIDNPGKCVVTDEGRAADGTCHFNCHEQNAYYKVTKPKTGCPLVIDYETLKATQNQPGTPPINAATPVAAPAHK